MIKRFISIKGTGQFLEYEHSMIPLNDRIDEFKKLNLIYGENGSGKTTLSIILKSLQGDSNLLLKKRSFNKTISQKIEILTDLLSNPKFTFYNSIWSQYYPEIDIFDIHFVNENIYTGLAIENSHRKNLFEVIFGQQGVQIKKDIQIIKDRIQASNTTLSDVAGRIKESIGGVYTVTDYCRIPIDNDIDDKIDTKISEIEKIKSFQEIQTKQQLSTVPLFSLPVTKEEIIGNLNKSINTISKTYLEKYQKHKEHLGMDGNAEHWIKQGYEAIAGNKCPFCLQSLDESVEIIEAYNQYFNEEYINLIQKIADNKISFDDFNIEAKLIEIDKKIIENQTLVDFWKKYLADPPSCDFIVENKEIFSSLYKAVTITLEAKLSNPIKCQNVSAVDNFQNKVDELNVSLTILNDSITAYNKKIATLQTSKPVNVAQLELDLKKLQAIKKRGETPIVALCDKHIACVQENKRFNKEKDTMQQKLDKFSRDIFKSYSAKINTYLQAFAPYLEIRNLDSGYVGSSKEPQIKYALHINGTEIKEGNDLMQPTFKYSFSEGDKSALALAFFLTKLEVDGNLQNKIIVFDDPVSSFDLNRKSTTINKLIDFGQQAKQLFILTHNLIFASDFWKAATHTGASCCCSRIGFLNNSSCLGSYSIENETLTSVLKDALAIKDYLVKGCLNERGRRSIARCIRPALESYFHLKFFDLVSDNEWLGNFIDKVRNSTTADPCSRLKNKLSELTDINDYSKKYHHRFNGACDTEPVTDAELRDYCKRTLDLIQLI